MKGVLPMPRRLFRKIVVEPSQNGWRARVVGFDPRFYSSKLSREYRTRAEALSAAHRAGRAWGLPVVAVETLTNPGGPERAA
jgi:hypothetical protein